MRLQSAREAAPPPKKARRADRVRFTATTWALPPLEFRRHDQELQALLTRLRARHGLAGGAANAFTEEVLRYLARVGETIGLASGHLCDAQALTQGGRRRHVVSASGQPAGDGGRHSGWPS